MRTVSLICGGLLWASASFAVSRVGGGTCSNPDEGFAYTIPLTFSVSSVYSDDSVQLSGFMVFGPLSGQASFEKVNQYLLRPQIPELADVTDRAEVVQYFLRKHWSRVGSADPCLEIYSYESAFGYSVVIGWGAGRGLVLSGPPTDHVKWGIGEIVNSIQLNMGACSWK